MGRLDPAQVDVHGVPPRALCLAHLDHVRRLLRRLRPRPARVPPDQSPAARGQRRRLLPDRVPPAAGGDSRREGPPAATPALRRPCRAGLRGSPAAGRVGGLGHGAEGRPLRSLLPPGRPRLSQAGAELERGARRPAPAVLGLPSALHRGAVLEVHGGHPARGAAPARHLSPPPLPPHRRRTGILAGPRGAPREAALLRPQCAGKYRGLQGHDCRRLPDARDHTALGGPRRRLGLRTRLLPLEVDLPDSARESLRAADPLRSSRLSDRAERRGRGGADPPSGHRHIPHRPPDRR